MLSNRPDSLWYLDHTPKSLREGDEDADKPTTCSLDGATAESAADGTVALANAATTSTSTSEENVENIPGVSISVCE